MSSGTKSKPSFLTEKHFLGYFHKLPRISRSEFIKKMTVMYHQPLTFAQIFTTKTIAGRKPIITKKDDIRLVRRKDIIDYFYEILITNRYKYLALFYRAYFQFPDPRTMNWKYTDLIGDRTLDGFEVISTQKNDASRRIIRNLFHLELLHHTQITNTVKNQVSFWESLTNLYNKFMLEDRFFAPSSIDQLLSEKNTKREQLSGIREVNYNILFYLFQAYQPKASIFNPYSIKWILDEIIPVRGNQMKLFTPVLSWGSYVVSFMHSPHYQTYVGVDVMSSVCKKTEFLASYYQSLDPEFDKSVSIYCTPSEDLLKNRQFMKKYREYFDTILICPPYYDMEIYHEGEQSTTRYPDYKTWLDKYWGDTVKLCRHVLKKGGTFAVIGNDYKTLKGEIYPLTGDLDKYVKNQRFKFQNMYYLQNRTSPLRVNTKNRTERLFIYSK